MSFTRRSFLGAGLAALPIGTLARARRQAAAAVRQARTNQAGGLQLLVLALPRRADANRTRHRRRGAAGLRRRRDPAPADAGGRRRLRQRPQAARVSRRRRPGDALDSSGLRHARPGRAAEGHRPHQALPRTGRPAGHPVHPPQLGALEHHQVVRRPDEGQGRRAADRRSHRQRRLRLGHRVDSRLPADGARRKAS